MEIYNFDIVDADGCLFVTLTIRENSREQAEEKAKKILYAINDQQIAATLHESPKRFYIDARAEMECAE